MQNLRLDDRVLSEAQKAELFKNGFVVVPAAVSQDLVLAALRLINQNLGEGVSEEQARKAKSSTWCPSIVSSPEITNLFNASDAISLVGSALGRCKQAFGGQIALRHPGTLCTDKISFQPAPWWGKMWHIDGFHSKDNGIAEGEIRNFTCLVGVILTDIPGEFCGNLAVYPRSHHVLHEYFRTKGFDEAKKDGLSKLPYLPLAQPVQITGKPGDVVICHYQLAHTIAPNCSPYTRYTVYFRINARSGEGVFDPAPMLDIWQDWPGMADVVARHRPAIDAELAKISLDAAGPGAHQPGYSDEVSRAKSSSSDFAKDAEGAALRKQGDDLFARHEFKQAQPIFTRLLEIYPRDFMVVLQAACCFTFSPTDSDVAEGEKWARKLVQIYPASPHGYTLLAQNLNRQNKPEESLANVKQMLHCHPTEDTPDYVFDGLKCAAEVLVKLKRGRDLAPLVEQARSKYPKMTARLAEISSGLEAEELWAKGRELIQAEKKDFVLGRQVFTRLVELRPTDYWATLLLGACLTWSGRCPEGEPHILRAIALDPKVPNGYALLAQNYLMQSKRDGVLETVDRMLAISFPTVPDNSDHAEKIIEALTCVRQVSGGGGSKLQSLVAQAKAKYPTLATRLASL